MGAAAYSPLHTWGMQEESISKLMTRQTGNLHVLADRKESKILGLLSSAGFLIGDWSSPSSQGYADSWEYCPSGQAGQRSRPLQEFTKKFSEGSNHDPKHKWDCHFLLGFHAVKKWGRNANYKVLCLPWKMECAMYPFQVLTCKSKWELVASC